MSILDWAETQLVVALLKETSDSVGYSVYEILGDFNTKPASEYAICFRVIQPNKFWCEIAQSQYIHAY